MWLSFYYDRIEGAEACALCKVVRRWSNVEIYVSSAFSRGYCTRLSTKVVGTYVVRT